MRRDRQINFPAARPADSLVERRCPYGFRGAEWDGGGSWKPTTVVWTLEPVENGTRLVLEHRGFQGFRPFLLSLMMGSGWKRKLTQHVLEIVTRLDQEALVKR